MSGDLCVPELRSVAVSSNRVHVSFYNTNIRNCMFSSVDTKQRTRFARDAIYISMSS
jgi:hypothetical protein